MKKCWYIYLDDIRKPEKDFKYSKGIPITVIVRDYNSMIGTLIDLLNTDSKIIIDLDHDLGEEKTGYDVCKWIVENQYPLTAFHVHTMNPVGRANMIQLLKHYGYEEI